MLILKTEKQNDFIPTAQELNAFMEKHNLTTLDGLKIAVAFKRGKRKKLKSLRIVSYVSYPCDCCGKHTYLTYLRKGELQAKELHY